MPLNFDISQQTLNPIVFHVWKGWFVAAIFLFLIDLVGGKELRECNIKNGWGELEQFVWGGVWEGLGGGGLTKGTDALNAQKRRPSIINGVA